MTQSTALQIRLAAWCCVLLSPLWIVTMFGRGVWTPDEPREADISWRMSTQDDRAVPMLAARTFLEKPPLAYWAAGLSARLIPDSDAALRSPNLVYAIVATMALVLLGFAAGGSTVAWVTGAMSGSALLALQVSAWLATDASMMCGVALALLGFYRGILASASRTKLARYLLMHCGLAVAFMSKGPAGWLVPVLAAACFLVLERKWRELARWEIWIGLAIPVTVIGAWCVAVARSADGLHDLSMILWSNVAGRVLALPGADAIDFSRGHRNWPGKYLLELPTYLLPWTFLFVAALRRAWRAARGASGLPWRFALCALWPPLLALSLATTARGIYAGPIIPGAALLTGLWAAQALQAPDRFDRRMMVFTIVLVGCLALLLLGLTGGVLSAGPITSAFWPAITLGTMGAGIALVHAIRCARRGAWTNSCAATFAAFALAFVACGVASFPVFDRWQDIASLMRAVDKDAGARTLALYAPDETLSAVVDRTLRARRMTVVAPGDLEASRRMLSNGNGVVLLVTLPGHGDGPVMRRLRGLGIHVDPASESPGSFDALAPLGLEVERLYELPQGRRYALLSVPAANQRVSVNRPDRDQ